jgi:Endonuclease NucS C-terminal domain
MMDQNQPTTLSLKAAYAFGAEHGLQNEVDEIRDMVIEWDRSYTSSLRRGYIVDLFEKRGVFELFKGSHWAYGNTPAGETRRRLFLRIKQQYESFLAGGDSPDGTEYVESEDEESDQQFAAESDLRDFLAKNPTRIEPGLSLYRTGDQSGIEFPVENGVIDILALDGEGRFVVIELKVGRGRNKTVGQLLYYMGWVDKNLGKGPCRGIIIAKEIPDGLMLAVQRIPGVSVCRYHLAVSVELVSLKA